jgi:glucose/arabinose dehydrogenase
MKRPRLVPLLVLGLIGVMAPVSAGVAERDVPEPGFVVTPFSLTGGAPSSVSVGRDTRGGNAERVYVSDYVSGQILAIDDLGGIGAPPAVFAEGFSSPLGVYSAPDGSVYVADSESAREGPFGFRPYGRVWRVVDKNKDGVGDKRTLVLKDLPNGRHNTNGMAIGPDGLLYVANGNATDDGVEGGEAEVDPWSGSIVRVSPKAKGVSLASLSRKRALVAHGMRNVYDLAFSPVRRSLLFIPTNGTDDARKGSTGENPIDPNLEDSDDLLYSTDVGDRKVDDFGFPSCLYNQAERGNLKPYTSPNADVRKAFGPCPKRVPRPAASFGLHVSADGLAFQDTGAWGAAYKNDLFVAEWGSLFGAPTGHKVVRVELSRSGRRVVAQHDFLELDLPIDVAFDKSGVMYVADFSGTIFRVDKPV